MKNVKIFRIVGMLEGLSFLVLLFVAVPLKYLAGYPQGVKALGMPHGILFIAYVVLAFDVAADLNWSKKRLLQAFVAAFLPFGTIVFDRKFLRST